jgi:hypothetical protein
MKFIFEQLCYTGDFIVDEFVFSHIWTVHGPSIEWQKIVSLTFLIKELQNAKNDKETQKLK